MKEWWIAFHGALHGLDVVIEDDGKVAYAYLRDGKGFTADVWLYNRAGTPEALPWQSPEAEKNMPFLNPRAYAEDFRPPTHTDQFSVSWSSRLGDPTAFISIDGDLHAILKPNAKPGWCRLARRNGPLALRMTEFKEERS